MKNQDADKLNTKITELKNLLGKLDHAKSISEKILVLDQLKGVIQFKNTYGDDCFDHLPKERIMLLKSLIAISQEHIVLNVINSKNSDGIFRTLAEVDKFYSEENGLLVYQLNILRLIMENEEGDRHFTKTKSNKTFLKPFGTDLSKLSFELNNVIRCGIENLDKIAEIYPIGGAGERLKLCDPKTEEPLPVAMLPFLGTTLLDGLIRDLESREYLYFKLMKKQLIIPVAMMTSDENANHTQIQNLCEKKQWYNRPRTHFFLFSQPMVPLVTIKGDFLFSSPTELMLKPSGHGVIWKLILENGVLDWFKSHGKLNILSRQINNPVAGVDSGLLGFSGIGFKQNHCFGFASCERHLHASEGMDILIEEKTDFGFEYKITNIEYTELVKNGIEDRPNVAGGHYSKFPANTNILFINIEAIVKLIEKCPIPGMLINMKTTIPYIDASGSLKKIFAGRLESTMQNIADVITDSLKEKIDEENYRNLSSFVTYNKRSKTISVTKKSYSKGNSFLETPESCFYDINKNNHELFLNYCHVNMPEEVSIDYYLENGPAVLISYHPALGPLYSVISQKIRKGNFLNNSELQLEIAEVDIENLELDGSLIIQAGNITGALDEFGIKQYGKNLSKCLFKNVKVKNLGIDRKAKNIYWKNEIKRQESMTITLHGNAEFVAENVTFSGNVHLEVMEGERLRVVQQGDELVYKKENVSESTPYWDYAFDTDDSVILTRI